MKHLVIIGIVGLVLGLVCTAHTENLLSNPGFETWKDGTPDAWNISVWPAQGQNAFTVTADNVIKAEGQCSVRLSLSSDITPDKLKELRGSTPWLQCSVAGRIPLTGGKFYRLTGWAKTANIQPQTYARINISFIDGSTNWTAGWQQTVMQNDDWTPVEMLFKTPPEAVSGYLSLQLCVNEMAGPDKPPSAWYDGLSLEEFVPPAAPAVAVPKTMTYQVCVSGLGGTTVDDKDASSGKAWYLKAGKDSPAGDKMEIGTLSLDNGIYQITYRMKVADNTKNQVVFTPHVTGNGFDPTQIAVLAVKGTDFKEANKYQDFTFYFVHTATWHPEYLGWWSGQTDVWLDTVTVKQLKVFTDQELLKYTPLPDEKKNK